MPRIAATKTAESEEEAKPATKPAAKKAAALKAAPAATKKNDDIPDTESWFVTLDDDTRPDWANVLLWGKEGSAKTSAVARMANLPGPGKALVINAEGGLKKKALTNRGVDLSNLVVWPDPRKGETITRAGLDRVFRRVKADLMKDPDSWKGVAWDSASEIMNVVLDQATETRQSRLTKNGVEFDPDLVDRADYGTMSKMLRDLLRKFRDLPCHFFVTALERRDIDPTTKKVQYGPAINPALQKDILGYVDVTIKMKAGDEEGPYRGLVKESTLNRVKDRFDVFPRVMPEVTADRVIAYINGDLTPETDPFMEDLPESARTSEDKPKNPPKVADDDLSEDLDGEAADENDN